MLARMLVITTGLAVAIGVVVLGLYGLAIRLLKLITSVYGEVGNENT